MINDLFLSPEAGSLFFKEVQVHRTHTFLGFFFPSVCITHVYMYICFPFAINVIWVWLSSVQERHLYISETSPSLRGGGTILNMSRKKKLWLIFFADAAKAIQNSNFKEIIFADDLNAYKVCDESTRNSTLLKHATKCQTNLHHWG